MICPISGKECVHIVANKDNCYSFEGRNGVPSCINSARYIAGEMHRESLSEPQAKHQTSQNASLLNLNSTDLWLEVMHQFDLLSNTDPDNIE